MRVPNQTTSGETLQSTYGLYHLTRLKARRTAYLSEGEWELLLQEAGVREALARQGVPG